MIAVFSLSEGSEGKDNFRQFGYFIMLTFSGILFEHIFAYGHEVVVFGNQHFHNLRADFHCIQNVNLEISSGKLSFFAPASFLIAWYSHDSTMACSVCSHRNFINVKPFRAFFRVLAFSHKFYCYIMVLVWPL